MGTQIREYLTEGNRRKDFIIKEINVWVSKTLIKKKMQVHGVEANFGMRQQAQVLRSERKPKKKQNFSI